MDIDIKKRIKQLDKKNFSNKNDLGRCPEGRYSSYDYCFNYFKSFKNKSDISNNFNIEKSCLHLGFYLASWGMYRGSTILLQRSSLYLKEIIQYISQLDGRYWNADIFTEDKNKQEESIKIILEVWRKLDEILKEDNKHNTLPTKIMLGVFGFIPAFDTYFDEFFFNFYKENYNKKIRTKNTKKDIQRRKILEGLISFYEDAKYKNIIDSESLRKTYDFNTKKESEIKYTKAKIIDMIGFSWGLKNLGPGKE